MPRIIFALLFIFGFVCPSQAADRPCPPRPQPMPPAIESADLPENSGSSNAITFAAIPALEYPGRAWVVHLFQRTHRQPATLTVVRLLRRNDCNVYDVEARWEAPLRADEYQAVAAKIASYVTALPGTFAPPDPAHPITVVADGTGLTLRVQTRGWQVERELNYSESEGAELSTVFYNLLAPVVPTSERPDEDWYMRR